MSLDVSLHADPEPRECPHCGSTYQHRAELYSRNITHNLSRMAGAAGMYEFLWRPDELGITKASELIAPLTNGLAMLKSEPERFKAFNPENGWGNYEGLVEMVDEYLTACRNNPDAAVSVSR